MNAFAELLDRLAFEPSRLGKLRLMTEFFRHQPDPERGYALAALTGALSFQHAKPGLIRGLISERVDPVLFALSYDFVGDLSETVALLWPDRPDANRDAGDNGAPLLLSDVVRELGSGGKIGLASRLAAWLDALDETGRWALLKLITGSLRVGVSARLAKTAVAELGGKKPNEVEETWHSLRPPYLDLFAWMEGREDRPDPSDPAPFCPAMLAHAIEERDFDEIVPSDFIGEWKWDGIRVQAASGRDGDGRRAMRLFSRTGEDISAAFPDLTECLVQLPFEAFSLDGELLIVRDARVEPFGVLQQRLNRKTASVKLLAEFPAHIRAYDLLRQDGEDLRALTFTERRARLEAFAAAAGCSRLDLSPLVPFVSWEELAQARKNPAAFGAGQNAEAIEGLMLKRKDSIYVPGRPKGLWYKWKRDPFTVDAVLMYAQRGHGKRSSYYSDFTFGVWRDEPEGARLVPVGKAYFGFTDAELIELDRYVRNHTVNRFGPVREVAYGRAEGLVLEIAFEGLNRSSRHKSGVAMRFPRIARIRWDKPAREADRIEGLEALLR
ncbi:cisplatin damage response ATP-dependent DNA ligase [Methylocella tundrae]|uniref:DNA ligase (ATP) n=1 Tax=Methylocella tundrae TaxID=227605 RepID=A0A4U8YU45_METTU|nr:cisplatin damage response ATP-dependent DNA ligase [Methylocella tundrae]WPP04996.1 cisplatin damage response ATP-dependent DNA ligase [Methylocella tundrae]VFU07289.1 ATP-dependent DNA ligase [Methylocella tundrae]